MDAKMDVKGFFTLFKDAFAEWNEDKAPRLAAALAYYTAFSIAPLLLIAITIASFFYADADAQARAQVAAILPGGGDAILGLLDNANKSGSTGIAALIGFVTLLFGASGLFGQLQDALNTIWEVQPKPNQGILATLKNRFFSFSMVLGTGFLLLVSLVISAGLSFVIGQFQNMLSGADIIWATLSYLVTFALVTGIFALIFRFIPDVKIGWGDVMVGAAITAVLFMIGQFILNLYLGNQENAYGVFGSLIVLLLWVFYSAQILFFGAEITQVYARKYGSQIEPADNAVAVSEASRENQGLPRKGNTSSDGAQQPKRSGAGRSVPAPAKLTEPSTPPKPGALTTAAGFALGWLLGKRNKTK